MKKEIRILGVDDAPFTRQDKEVLIVCTVYRGGSFIDGLLSFRVKRDGDDSTSKLIKAVNKTKHKAQLQYIITDGICLAGFNIIDICEIYKKTILPVIVIMRKKPNMKKFFRALEKANKGDKKNKDKKVQAIKKAGKIQQIKVNGKKLYLQLAGISLKSAKKVLEISCKNSAVPEPIRVAHIIASGIVLGESHGKS